MSLKLKYFRCQYCGDYFHDTQNMESINHATVCIQCEQYLSERGDHDQGYVDDNI